MLQTGRTIRDTSPKWWFPPGKPGAHEFLWGANRIEPGAEEIIVVEGIFDAVWDDRRVAIFGSNMSSFQVNILTRDLAPKKITIALDRDALDKARILATRIAMIWTAEIYIVELPRKKDPCDLGYDGSTTIEKSKELWI